MRNPTPRSILADFPAPIQRLANELRILVKKEAPAAYERAYPGWNAIGFRDIKAGYFCGLFPQEDSIRLIFEFGAFLDDPHQILEGKQAQIRSYNIRNSADLKRKALREMLRQAISYGRQRKKAKKEGGALKKNGTKVTRRLSS